MDLSSYYKLLDEIDGLPREKLPEGVTTKELDFREGKGKEGSATIYFKDAEPIMVAWYVWDLDHDWFLDCLEQELGYKIKLVDSQGGNGHYQAAIQVTV